MDIEELAENMRILMEENEALNKIISADSPLLAAVTKNKQLTAENKVLRERVAGLMEEKNFAIRAARKPKAVKA